MLRCRLQAQAAAKAGGPAQTTPFAQHTHTAVTSTQFGLAGRHLSKLPCAPNDPVRGDVCVGAAAQGWRGARWKNPSRWPSHTTPNSRPCCQEHDACLLCAHSRRQEAAHNGWAQRIKVTRKKMKIGRLPTTHTQGTADAHTEQKGLQLRERPAAPTLRAHLVPACQGGMRCRYTSNQPAVRKDDADTPTECTVFHNNLPLSKTHSTPSQDPHQLHHTHHTVGRLKTPTA